MWVLTRQGSTQVWQVSAWQDCSWLVHGVTTKDSGNLALHTTDDPAEVVHNRERLATDLGVELASWVEGQQVHQDQIGEVRACDVEHTPIPNTDALVTKEAGVFLASFYADCVPLLFFARQRRVLAMAHAGWRGTLLGIGGKVVNYLQAAHHIDPKHVEVAIGPSIGPCCYTIGSEVAEQFDAEVVQPSPQGDCLDLWQANQRNLESMGVLRQHIHAAQVCTACSQNLYSYRRDQGGPGRIGAFLYRREDL